MAAEGEGAKKKVCLVGSGNWGSAIAKIVGGNARRESELFDERVRMWVHEETLGDGRKLSEVINKEHENVKYLPNVKLPDNVVAVTDLREAAKDADVLIFVVPNQFLLGTCQTLSGHISSKSIAISLIKGVEVSAKDGECPITLVSDIIQQELHIDVSVLMGANIAEGVALEQFCETTIGYRNLENGELFKKLFHTPHFRVTLIEDVVGVELCGALKNVVALAAGFVDALHFGDNTKAAIIRLGLLEMKRFCQFFFDESSGNSGKMAHGSIKEQTFLESCGVADLITSCYGGRNRKVAEQFAITRKSWEELEKEMLNGQHLQGTLMAKAVETILQHHRRMDEFPLFRTVIRICFHGLDPSRIVEDI